MNRWFAGLAIFALVVGGAWLFLLKTPSKPVPPGHNPSTASSPASNPVTISPARSQPASNSTVPVTLVAPVSAATTLTPATRTVSTSAKKSAPGGPAGPDLDPSGLPPATVLENTRSVFRNFASRFGGNPVGTNPEISAALNGGNPKQVNFLEAEDGLRINARGELIDSWGTPYFFHQLSGTEMEIHSAGPDRTMWTPDDLVIK